MGRLLPGKLQPLELAAELTRAMDHSANVSPQGTLVANRYRLLLAPPDFDLLGGLRGELEAEFARDLAEHAAENDYIAGPLVRVSLRPEASVTPGRARVESSFDEAPVAARLTVLAGLPPQTFAVRGEALLGRAEDCTVRLDEAAVSRHHARLRWTYAGYRLEDLGSSNGAFVNGAPVRQALLHEGDVLEVGLVQMRLSHLAE